ncbi:uncharacterized protein LOC119867225 isoform X1 [Canis lupus familiaris]|nr:uncharacterized protein LOC119867225 isoform X1 [Canis lupus familiaris]
MLGSLGAPGSRSCSAGPAVAGLAARASVGPLPGAPQHRGWALASAEQFSVFSLPSGLCDETIKATTLAPTRYVLEQTQVAGAVHQLSRTSVTNLCEGRKHLFGQRLEAEAAGAAPRGAPHRGAAPGERVPAGSKGFSSPQAPQAEGHRDAARNARECLSSGTSGLRKTLTGACGHRPGRIISWTIRVHRQFVPGPFLAASAQQQLASRFPGEPPLFLPRSLESSVGSLCNFPGSQHSPERNAKVGFVAQTISPSPNRSLPLSLFPCPPPPPRPLSVYTGRRGSPPHLESLRDALSPRPGHCVGADEAREGRRACWHLYPRV